MFVQTLTTYQLRNLDSQKLVLSSGLNIITGRNGQGKTNIVEALNLLSLGKSFRTSKLSELIAWGKDEASVFAEVVLAESEVRLGVILRKGSRETLVNDDKTPLVQFVGRLLCVTFSPTDIEVIKGAPQERRRFLDKHLVDLHPGILKNLVSYATALKNKNALLKSGCTDRTKFQPWNRVLAREAALIGATRREFVSRLNEESSRIYSQFAESDGELTTRLKEDIPEGDEARIIEVLESEVAREIGMRSSLRGIHKDDLIISIEGKQTRHYASQGQSKSSILALKLGVIELLEKRKGERPVVLLDDVDSELDRVRTSALYGQILKDGRQVFITGTEVGNHIRERFSSFREYEVRGGIVETLTH